MDRQTYEQIDRMEMKIDIMIKQLCPDVLDKDNKIKEK